MKDRKEKKQWWLILFIILIMVGTSVSFVFFGFGQNEVEKYNGIKFARVQDRWEAKISGKNAAFSFLPSEVENIPFADSAGRLKGKPEIDVTYDLNSTYKEAIALAQHQMGLTLAQYNIFARKGFTANNTFSLPVITCNVSTQNVPVIYFKYGNITGIHAENSCIIAEANSNAGFIKAKDRLLYGILGVVK